MAIDYEYEQALSELQKAAELHNEAANLPNPGGFWRGIQSLLVDVNSDERDSDKQARIDERRQELYAESEDHMREAASWARSMLSQLESYGIPRDRVVPRLTALLGDRPSPFSVNRCMSSLRDMVKLVELLDRLRSEVPEQKQSIINGVHGVANRYGMDGRAIISYNNQGGDE